MTLYPALVLFNTAISILALILALAALAMVIGMKLSTHKIEFRPLDSYEPFKEEEEKEDNSDEILEKTLGLQRKKKKKEEDPLDAIAETSNF